MSAPRPFVQADADSRNGVRNRLTNRPRPRPRRVVENDDFAAFCRRIIRAFSRRVAGGDIEAFRTLVTLRTELDDGMREAVAGLRDNGYSWAEIGAVLGMTRQSAHERWGRAS